MEAKAIIIFTLRLFDFLPALQSDSESIIDWGGKGHQILKLTPKLKDGMPMTVKILNV